jgi:hypothetical protein
MRTALCLTLYGFLSNLKLGLYKCQGKQVDFLARYLLCLLCNSPPANPQEVSKLYGIDEQHSRFRAFHFSRGNRLAGMARCHGGGEEYASIMKNDVWDVVPRPERKLVVSSRWLYKIKHATNGSIEKFKARLVARRFSQREGVGHEKTFALVLGFIYRIENTSDGCEDSFPQWYH